MNYLYEGQIRSLGPSGTIPLLAFIKSKESRANPEIRHRAMQIVAELAPESTRGDFIRLRADADATIAELAKGALGRLDQEMPQ
jgi:hypothetical protein